MYAAVAPRSAGSQVDASCQSKGGSAEREPILTGTPRACRRSDTRRPVLPVPPTTNVVS